MPKINEKSKKQLYEDHLLRNVSFAELGKQYDVSGKTISRYFNDYQKNLTGAQRKSYYVLLHGDNANVEEASNGDAPVASDDKTDVSVDDLKAEHKKLVNILRRRSRTVHGVQSRVLNYDAYRELFYLIEDTSTGFDLEAYLSNWFDNLHLKDHDKGKRLRDRIPNKERIREYAWDQEHCSKEMFDAVMDVYHWDCFVLINAITGMSGKVGDEIIPDPDYTQLYKLIDGFESRLQTSQLYNLDGSKGKTFKFALTIHDRDQKTIEQIFNDAINSKSLFAIRHGNSVDYYLKNNKQPDHRQCITAEDYKLHFGVFEGKTSIRIADVVEPIDIDRMPEDAVSYDIRLKNDVRYDGSPDLLHRFKMPHVHFVANGLNMTMSDWLRITGYTPQQHTVLQLNRASAHDKTKSKGKRNVKRATTKTADTKSFNNQIVYLSHYTEQARSDGKHAYLDYETRIQANFDFKAIYKQFFASGHKDVRMRYDDCNVSELLDLFLVHHEFTYKDIVDPKSAIYYRLKLSSKSDHGQDYKRFFNELGRRIYDVYGGIKDVTYIQGRRGGAGKTLYANYLAHQHIKTDAQGNLARIPVPDVFQVTAGNSNGAAGGFENYTQQHSVLIDEFRPSTVKSIFGDEKGLLTFLDPHSHDLPMVKSRYENMPVSAQHVITTSTTDIFKFWGYMKGQSHEVGTDEQFLRRIKNLQVISRAFSGPYSYRRDFNRQVCVSSDEFKSMMLLHVVRPHGCVPFDMEHSVWDEIVPDNYNGGKMYGFDTLNFSPIKDDYNRNVLDYSTTPVYRLGLPLIGNLDKNCYCPLGYDVQDVLDSSYYVYVVDLNKSNFELKTAMRQLSGRLGLHSWKDLVPKFNERFHLVNIEENRFRRNNQMYNGLWSDEGYNLQGNIDRMFHLYITDMRRNGFLDDINQTVQFSMGNFSRAIRQKLTSASMKDEYVLIGKIAGQWRRIVFDPESALPGDVYMGFYPAGDNDAKYGFTVGDGVYNRSSFKSKSASLSLEDVSEYKRDVEQLVSGANEHDTPLAYLLNSRAFICDDVYKFYVPNSDDDTLSQTELNERISHENTMSIRGTDYLLSLR